MTALKILAGILGILMVIGGFICMLTPSATFASIPWVIGIIIFISALGDILEYSSRKKLGFADGWSLAGSIISMIFAIFLIFSNSMQFMVENVLALTAGIWLIVDGITHIASAIRMNRIRRLLPENARGNVWLATLIVGILMLIGGIVAIIVPNVVVVTIGILMSILIIITGAKLVAGAFA